tara:strand:- start:3992 stop:4345 length:354 start_codon:yes stop_codon:yes gene_type:complete
MPRAKPDIVHIHRIELGSWERDHLSAVLATQSFENVATPIVALLSDNTAMALILTTLGGWYGFSWVMGEYGDTFEMMMDWREQLQASPQYRESAAEGFAEGSPWPDFIDRWMFDLLL